MRNSSFNVYKVDDGFIGRANEVSKHLNISTTEMLNLIWNKGSEVNGRKIEKVYNYTPLYGAYEDEKLIATGTYKELAEKFFLSPSTVRNAKNTKRKLLGLYEVREIEGITNGKKN